jgi:DNA adenine methylase
MMTAKGVQSEFVPADPVKTPYPYFGGKRKVAPQVWERFGNVPNYIEPFFGGGSVLLGRPHAPGIETINDIDCDIANVWRAIQWAPDEVATWADWPVNEADLHAIHRWLVESKAARGEQIRRDPDYFDAKAAGRWLYGIALWIGGEWCQGLTERRPSLEGDRGIQRRWNSGGQGCGQGVHSPTVTKQQIPELSGDSGATGRDIHASGSIGVYEWMRALQRRMRLVRVCCGDWTRVLTPSVTTYIGVTGVFLDPPYDHELRDRVYAHDGNISVAVREWALAHGDDPKFRIALCGYVDEHGDAMPKSWECVPWKAHGGMSRNARAVENREQERIWFSPHCLRREDRLPFDEPVAPTLEPEGFTDFEAIAAFVGGGR